MYSKARLTRKKPKQAPSKTEQKKVSAEQLLSDEVPKVLSRYKGNKYNISKVSKLVKDLQQAFEDRLKENTWMSSLKTGRSFLSSFK